MPSVVWSLPLVFSVFVFRLEKLARPESPPDGLFVCVRDRGRTDCTPFARIFMPFARIFVLCSAFCSSSGFSPGGSKPWDCLMFSGGGGSAATGRNILDKKNHLVADEVQGVGTVDHAPVYPREIMRRALELGASAIIVHNHPSGDPQPSTDDINLTHQIVAVGKPLKVAVHDHLIIDKHGHASLKGLRLI
jgi:hypothetical protein